MIEYHPGTSTRTRVRYGACPRSGSTVGMKCLNIRGYNFIWQIPVS